MLPVTCFIHSSRFWRRIAGVVFGCIALCIFCSTLEEKVSEKQLGTLSIPRVKYSLSVTEKLQLDTFERTTHMPGNTSRTIPICPRTIVRKRSFPNLRMCLNYTTRLCEEGTFNSTALVSYPGSGNTWLRHLIEIATGFFTGSVYFDHTLLARGFLGEKEDWSSGSTIVQKLHVKYDVRQNFKKGILIIREPIAATRSFVDYMESGHTGWASPTTFNRKEWPLYLLRSTHDWIELNKSWIESPVEVMVVHYENLINSTVNEVRKVIKFLALDNSRIDSECFMNSIEGSFHRKPPVWKINSPIPLKFRRVIDDGIDYLNQLLLQHDKEQIPLHKYSCYRKTSEKCIKTEDSKI